MPKAIIEALKRNMRRALIDGNLGEAESILAHLKREDPLSPDTRGLELEFYLNSGKLADAGKLAEQLCRLFPSSARITFLAGKVDYRQKHYESAEAHFRESLRLYSHWRTRHWLGKTLTQLGKFGEAESLLLMVLENHRHALLDLAWLHERRNDLDAALKALDEFLSENPGHGYASEQRLRIRAKLLEPEELISEIGTLADLDEEMPQTLFPEFVRRLFETGQSPRARQEILAKMDRIDAKAAVQVAWVCYKAQAYDIACTLFLAHLGSNKTNFKYLAAMEAAADRCKRLPDVVAAYQTYLPEARHFFGRWRSLEQRKK
jgi:tetratricopeptide (TPR) repeat protein